MRIFYYFVTITWLFLLALLLAHGSNQEIDFVQGFADTSLTALKNWQSVINFSYNTFHQWKFDTWVLGLAAPLAGIMHDNIKALFVQQNLMLCLGLALLVRQLTPDSSWISWIYQAGLITLCLVMLFGMDLVLFASVLWLPWLLLALLRLKNNFKAQLFDYLLLLFFSLRLAASANQLALLLAILALVWICYFKNQTAMPGLKKLALAVLLCFPALIVLASAHAPNFPSYPWLGRVVPDDNLAGIIRPLIGSEPPLPVINRLALKAGLAPFAYCLLLASALALLIRRRSDSNNFEINYSLPLVLSLCLIIDLALPEGVSQIGPLASLTRIVPGLFHFALSPVISLLAAMFIMLGFIALKREILFSFFAFAFCYYGLLQGEQLRIGSSNIASADSVYKAIGMTAPANNGQLTAVFSPSYALLKERGLNLLNLNAQAQSSQLKSAHEFQISLSASHSENKLQQAMDGKAGTRWSAIPGQQTGSEWLQIGFPKTETLRGLELSTGNFSSDFPRGLKLSYTADCSAERSSYIDLSSLPDWQGVVEFTPEGAPYYGAQSEVKIFFVRDLQICKLLVEQIAKDNYFDWSVAEINFFVPKTG